MDEAFNSGFQLHKGAIVGQADDFAPHPFAHRIFLGRDQPGIFGQLFQTE